MPDDTVTRQILTDVLAEIKAIIAGHERLQIERDRRYEERDSASKERVSAAFAAAEKALEKLGQTDKENRQNANEWRGTLNDLVTRMPSRVELDAQFKAVNDKVAILSEARSKEGGRDEALAQSQMTTKWLIGTALLLLLTLIGYVVTQATP